MFIVAIALIVIVYVSWEIFSTVRFKRPSGSHAVGTLGMEVTDSSRVEDVLASEQKFRRLILQFWYPAKKSKGIAKANYHPNPDVFNNDVANLFKSIPQLLLKRLSLSKTNALVNAPLSDSESNYPLLVFSHGMDGMRFLNTFQMEELASHGYIVVSIEHSFAASGTVFSDGSKAGVTPYELMEDESFGNSMVNKWSADQVFAINYLEKLNKQDGNIFTGKLNMNELGIFGFSFGGAVSTNTLVLDKRIKAGVNLDGFYYGENYSKGFEQPFMEIRSQPAAPDKVSEKELEMSHLTRERWKFIWFDEWNKRLKSYARNGYYSYTIQGSNHFSFCDLPLMAPFQWLLAPKATRIHELTNQYTLAFFDKQLRGVDNGLLKEPIKLIK
jgi:predicted dienelactone hydrolase